MLTEITKNYQCESYADCRLYGKQNDNKQNKERSCRIAYACQYTKSYLIAK